MNKETLDCINRTIQKNKETEEKMEQRKNQYIDRIIQYFKGLPEEVTIELIKTEYNSKWIGLTEVIEYIPLNPIFKDFEYSEINIRPNEFQSLDIEKRSVSIMLRSKSSGSWIIIHRISNESLVTIENSLSWIEEQIKKKYGCDK